jgi:hypothetical protein
MSLSISHFQSAPGYGITPIHDLEGRVLAKYTFEAAGATHLGLVTTKSVLQERTMRDWDVEYGAV